MPDALEETFRIDPKKPENEVQIVLETPVKLATARQEAQEDALEPRRRTSDGVPSLHERHQPKRDLPKPLASPIFVCSHSPRNLSAKAVKETPCSVRFFIKY